MTLGTIPMAPRSLPVLGHAVQLVREPLEFIRSLAGQGDLARFRMGNRDVVMVCDPDLIHEVLADERTFDKGGPFFDRIAEMTGNGLVTCPHKDHRRQRRLIQPAFHPQRVIEYTPSMISCATAVVDSWKDGDVIDIFQEMQHMLAQSIISTMFGTAIDAATRDELCDNILEMVNGVFWRMISPPTLTRMSTPGNIRFRRALRSVRETLDRIAADMGTPGTHDIALVAHLIRATEAPDPEGRSQLSSEELLDQLVTFFGAGIETTASALTWALSDLSGNPDIAGKLHEEVDRVLKGSPPDGSHLGQLTFTEAVVTETLRLRSPIWIMTRVTTRDTSLGGHFIPSGSNVAISPYTVHHRSEYYPDPLRFDPERWEHKRPDRSLFLPFGAGARKCIGDRYNNVQAVLALAAITSRWHLEPVTSRPHRPVARIIVLPNGLRLRARKR